MENDRSREAVGDSLLLTLKLTEGKAEQDKKLDALLDCFKEGMEMREKNRGQDGEHGKRPQ